MINGESHAMSRNIDTIRRQRDAKFRWFDRYDYPGDVVMDWLRASTNLHWCRYYLGPVPDHPGKTWMARRKRLADAGWGIAPLYVGRQVQGGYFTATAAQGSADGQNAARMMAAEGFDADTYVLSRY
jgi:hypothetical protein